MKINFSINYLHQRDLLKPGYHTRGDSNYSQTVAITTAQTPTAPEVWNEWKAATGIFHLTHCLYTDKKYEKELKMNAFLTALPPVNRGQRLYSFLQLPATFSLLGPNIPSTCSQTFPVFFFCVTDKVQILMTSAFLKVKHRNWGIYIVEICNLATANEDTRWRT